MDVDFIISKSTVDKDGILCFQSKAATAIDHFLVSRFYDYMQVVYHKTVVGLEWSLDVLVKELLSRGLMHMSADDVSRLVLSRGWAAVDDSYVLSLFKKLHTELSNAAGTQVVCDHLRAVLYRKPAKQVYAWEGILPRDDDRAKLRLGLIKTKLADVLAATGIDRRRFEIIDRKPFPFSSDLSKSSDELTYGEQARSVSILEKGKKKSHLLSERRDAIVGAMSKMGKFGIRVLYLPAEGEAKIVRDEIRKSFAELD